MAILINPYRFAAAGGAPHWQELGRTTLGSNGSTISVTSLADKPYIMFLSHQITSGSGQIDGHGQLNGDTGANYAKRESDDGASDGAAGSQTAFSTGKGNGAAADNFVVGNILNIAAQEKLIMSHAAGGSAAGSGNVPSRREAANKWSNTSNAVSSIQLISGYAGANDFATGSECVVLGYDPADTSGTNAWEELASVTLGSASDTLIDATITAKKYLMIQEHKIPTGNCRSKYQFNGDTGTNYAIRASDDGGSDATSPSIPEIYAYITGGTAEAFINTYIVNTAAQEKLTMTEIVEQNIAGAGTAPQRRELVGKWANTSNQITSIKVFNDGTGDFDTGSSIKVWGFD